MLQQLEEVYGIEVGLDELRKTPTVAHLAVLTGGRSNRADVVALSSGAETTPFFCISGAGGLALNFLPLARLLGPGQPFYGLQTHAIESRGVPDFTLSQAAKRYVKEIRQVQSRGPYLIGGHSLGGVLALKVVQRLKAAGEEVALLVVFDTSLTRRMKGRKLLGVHEETNAVRGPRVFQERTKVSSILFLPFAGIVPRRGLAQFEVFGLHSTIQARLAKSLKPWSGRTVVYVSSDQSFGVNRDWKSLLTGTYTSVTIPGDHLSMMHRPNVALLAESLRAEIALALAPPKDVTDREDRET
jgi:thioesterase domain-containing protein